MSQISSNDVEYILLQTISEHSDPVGAGFLADTLHAQGISSASEATVGRYLRKLENSGCLVSRRYDGRSRGRVITPEGQARLQELITQQRQHKAVMDSMALFLDGFGQQLRNMLVTRSILEPEVAALAAKNATQEDIDAIGQIVAETAQLRQSGQSIAKTDAPFHIAIAKATGNPVLEAVMQMIRADRDYSPEIESIIDASSMNTPSDHLSIYNAIAQRNEKEARRIMKNHIQNLIEQCNRYEVKTKNASE